MEKIALLKQVGFGARVAEEETNELASYFVETDQWERIVRGEIDMIRGDKGAGKSAIYSLLLARTDQLFDRHILLIPGEKPRGATVFKDLEADPPTSEIEFVNLWKLYLLTLIAQKMKDFDIGTKRAQPILSALQEIGLLEADFDLSSVLRIARSYARRLFRLEAVEGGLNLDPNTGQINGFSGKILFCEPDKELSSKGFASVDSLIRSANAILNSEGYSVWILLDRLDVAFAENVNLEKNALRALFRVYLDLLEHDNIKLKIFLRSDIWKRISEEGFREASHITRYVTLEWKSPALLNLIMRRILNNQILLSEYDIDKSVVLNDFGEQEKLFDRLFPKQVEQGTRKPKTLDWMISRCADASDKTAPRELIHLVSALREKEIERLERGEDPAPEGHLFNRSVFKEALPAVSESRLVQNLYAEYPESRPYISKLTGEKTEQKNRELIENMES